MGHILTMLMVGGYTVGAGGTVGGGGYRLTEQVILVVLQYT